MVGSFITPQLFWTLLSAVYIPVHSTEHRGGVVSTPGKPFVQISVRRLTFFRGFPQSLPENAGIVP
jgi:hypothetical protein